MTLYSYLGFNIPIVCHRSTIPVLRHPDNSTDYDSMSRRRSCCRSTFCDIVERRIRQWKRGRPYRSHAAACRRFREVSDRSHRAICRRKCRPDPILVLSQLPSLHAFHGCGPALHVFSGCYRDVSRSVFTLEIVQKTYGVVESFRYQSLAPTSSTIL